MMGARREGKQINNPGRLGKRNAVRSARPSLSVPVVWGAQRREARRGPASMARIPASSIVRD